MGGPSRQVQPAGPPASGPQPRDAATVVLLRDGAAGVEVFLLRRVRAMAFAPGMTVFPGGAVDGRDAEGDIDWVGPPPADWTAALGAGERLARALVCAAVRETFEESGVLFAGPGPAELCAVDSPDWEADRTAVEAGALSLAGLLARRGLVLRADLLRPWAHWITPEAEVRRYDARFLIAALPAGQSTRDVTSEAERAEWRRPRDALADLDRGQRMMLPPTMVTLGEIARYRTVADVFAAAADRLITPITPILVDRQGDRLLLALPDGREVWVPAPVLGRPPANPAPGRAVGPGPAVGRGSSAPPGTAR